MATVLIVDDESQVSPHVELASAPDRAGQEPGVTVDVQIGHSSAVFGSRRRQQPWVDGDRIRAGFLEIVQHPVQTLCLHVDR